MSKISEKAKENYFTSISQFVSIAKRLERKETLVLNKLKIENSPYIRMELVDDYLCAFSQYIMMNILSVTMLGIKNENALNSARKICSKAVIELEKIFTNYVDVSYIEYKEALEATSRVPELERYALIRKTGLAMDILMDALGENNKWKWSQIEMQGRLAVVAKNTLDLKSLVQGLDPRTPNYQERVHYLNLIRKMLKDASDKYRTKYEGVTGEITDFQIAITYLSAMYRLSIMLGRNAEAVNLKRKIDVWTEKLNKDLSTRNRKPIKSGKSE